MAKIRMKVTRTLVYEGDQDWIDRVFQMNKVTAAEPIIVGGNSITEQVREVEWVKTENKAVDVPIPAGEFSTDQHQIALAAEVQKKLEGERG